MSDPGPDGEEHQMASSPIGLVAVVPVKRGSPTRVCHVWPVALVKSCRLFQKLLAGVENQPLLYGVDRKGLPGNSKQFVSHSQKTAERQYRVGNASPI